MKKKKIFASLKSLDLDSDPASSQRYGSADPDPHQNVMDPQHCFSCINLYWELSKAAFRVETK